MGFQRSIAIFGKVGRSSSSALNNVTSSPDGDSPMRIAKLAMLSRLRSSWRESGLASKSNALLPNFLSKFSW